MPIVSATGVSAGGHSVEHPDGYVHSPSEMAMQNAVERARREGVTDVEEIRARLQAASVKARETFERYRNG
jgi:hypothetical protein